MRLMAEEILIRNPEFYDLDQVIKINRICLPENYPKSFFESMYYKYKDFFLVAEVDQKIVAYMMNRLEHGFSNLKFSIVRKAHVISIATLPEYRRRGIAKKLILTSFDLFRKADALEVYLEVRVSNHAAIRLYEKLGFEIKKELKGYYVDGESAYLMVADLRDPRTFVKI